MIAVPFPSPFALELSAIEASCWEWSSEGTSKGRHDDWGAHRRARGTDGRKCEAKKGREEPPRVVVPAQTLGDGRGEQWEGWGHGAATPLTLNQSAKWQADGVKDAGETGAGAATTERGGWSQQRM